MGCLMLNIMRLLLCQGNISKIPGGGGGGGGEDAWQCRLNLRLVIPKNLVLLLLRPNNLLLCPFESLIPILLRKRSFLS